MAEKKRLLLKAKEDNWGEIYPGVWSSTKWQIYYDGSFERVDSFLTKESGSERSIKIAGKMDQDAFSKLCEAIKREPWRDPSNDILVFDGSAWEIVSYTSDGKVDKTSGKMDYIEGHAVLETIASLLPSEEGN